MATKEYFDLGKFERPISTSNDNCQLWFNRGFIWTYAFNHGEAVGCFQRSLENDPSCAMAYWGVAYASGPNYNKSWTAFDPIDLKDSIERCRAMTAKAKQVSSSASPVEQALIEAIQHRTPVDQEPESLYSSNKSYANAMRTVYKRFRNDDLDIAVLFADALMNISPWQLFEPRSGKPNLSTPVLEIQAVLQEAMARPQAREHPGLLHLFIHFTEMSTTPEAALVPADQLRGLVPDGSHLLHMPSHIYVLLGDYRQAIDANYKATLADDKFFQGRPTTLFYSAYRLHNFHSLIYAAMLAGQSAVALEATERMEASITEELLLVKSPPMVEFVEIFVSVRVHVLVRFGMWDAIKALSIPQNAERYCTTIVMTHYGKGIAWAATGDIDKANEERRLFREAAKRVPPSRLDFPNKVTDILKVGEAMLDGEIAYRCGDYETAFSALRLAIERDDALIYSEPWGWMVPTRHAFAALSLEQGRIQDALVAYAEDLGLTDNLVSAHQHPANVWSLQGYHRCLRLLGRNSEAKIVEQQLKVALAVADIPIRVSCFCSARDEQSRPNCDGCS